jgi:hypothetical protein
LSLKLRGLWVHFGAASASAIFRLIAQVTNRQRDAFGKRAAVALLWGLTVDDGLADDNPFLQALLLVERAANDAWLGPLVPRFHPTS